MKRVLALTFLAVLVIGPPVKWLCHHSCEAGHPVAATEKCHNSPDTKSRVIKGHVCAHALPIALAAKRFSSDSLLVDPLQNTSAFAESPQRLLPLTHSCAGNSAAPPPLSPVIPLRI